MGPCNNQTRPLECQFQCRTRRCLLKGCGSSYRPTNPASRYCSPKCEKAAREWQIKCARERYQRSAKGKAKRCEQSRGRRKRGKERDRSQVLTMCVGDRNENSQGVTCARPGCYEGIVRTKRSPCKKYCSRDCRASLRRVLERERRWRQRHRLLKR